MLSWTMSRRTEPRFWALLPVCLGGLLTHPAAAQDGNPPDQGASEIRRTSKRTSKHSAAAELLAVADRAHRLGQYGFAIQALKRAHQLDPYPGVWLAIGDAYYQRFLVKGAAYDRQQAITYFDGYLEARPSGSESERARRAMADLEHRNVADDDEALAKARAAERRQTRLAITSTALDATARIDGGKARKLPVFVFIEPGERSVVVSAEGYQDHVRDVEVERGFAYAINAKLAPKPAKLVVDTTSGAEVNLDDRFIGVAPFDEPIEVEPGTQRLVVTKNGHLPYSEQVTLDRGADHELEVDLTMTRQRIGAIFLTSTGGASIFASVVTGVLSFTNETTAQSNEGTEDGYAALARSRDFRVVSGMTAGIGLGLSLFGGILLTFDEPKLSISPQGPGQAGATVRIAF